MPIDELPENEEIFQQDNSLKPSPDMYQEIKVLPYPQH